VDQQENQVIIHEPTTLEVHKKEVPATIKIEVPQLGLQLHHITIAQSLLAHIRQDQEVQDHQEVQDLVVVADQMEEVADLADKKHYSTI